MAGKGYALFCATNEITRMNADAASSVHKTVAHRESNEFPNAVQIQLVHDSGSMPLDCVDTQPQQDGYFLIRFSFGDELQNLPLPHAEHIEGIGCMFAVIFQYGAGYFGTQVGVSSGYCSHRSEQLLVRRFLEQITFGACADDLAHINRFPQSAAVALFVH
jgi:hypothetical protein